MKGKICLLCTIVHIATIGAFYGVCLAVSQRKISVASLPLKRIVGDWSAWLFVAALVLVFIVVPQFERNNNRKADIVALTADEIDCVIAARVRMFGSAHCAVCRLQLSYFDFRNDEQKERFYIDCNEAENRAACEQMKLALLPTFVKFDEIGRPVGEKIQSLTSGEKIKRFAKC